jgi:hypothetical protein
MRSDHEALLEQIATAFAARQRPDQVTPETHPDSEIYQDAEKFSGRHWSSFTCAELDILFDGLLGMNAQAYCYFLPAVMNATIRENDPYIIMSDSILSEIEIAGEDALWTSIEANKFTLLTAAELAAVQDWVLWLSGTGAEREEDLLIRAWAALDKLKARAA